MTGPTQTYIIFLLSGLFLLALEVVVPGGVLGAFGGMALIGAALIGFAAFPAPWGALSAIAIVLLAGFSIAAWIKYLPNTPMGRTLTLSRDGRTFKSTPADMPELVGKAGVARTDLRPAGIAQIDGRRIDVVAEGSWIANEAPVKVIEVQGNRVVVRAVEQA